MQKDIYRIAIILFHRSGTHTQSCKISSENTQVDQTEYGYIYINLHAFGSSTLKAEPGPEFYPGGLLVKLAKVVHLGMYPTLPYPNVPA